MNTNRIIHAGFWFGKSDFNEAISQAKAGIGGFCIYGGTTQEVKELTCALRAAASGKILISADYEYGLGRWHKDAPLLPSNLSLGAAGRDDLAYKKGIITARHARQIGVDWVFAPDIDLADTPANPIVNTRSFGKDPNLVSRLAKAFMLGLADGGCLNCLKHFPGHGPTVIDSHLTLPTVNKTKAELMSAELVPYLKLFTVADAVMVAHLLIPALDGKNPASFSEAIIQDFLRKDLRYKGLIITDALVMKATGGLNAVDAFKAGAEILLCPDNPLETAQKLKEEISKDKTLINKAISALSRQEMLIAKIKPEKNFAYEDKDYQSAAHSLSLECAKQAVCLKGEFKPFVKNKTVYYIEADTFPQEEIKSEDFYAKLKAAGIKLKPYNPSARSFDTLLISTQANYAAFSGKINFCAEQKDLINKAAAKAKNKILVSFGSPFVDEGLNINAFLMAGTQTKEFQEVCADILLGQLKPLGKMPV